MDNIFLTGISDAVSLVVSLDPEVLAVTAMTLKVCLTAVTVATIIGIPFAAFLSWGKFPGRNALIMFANTMMGLPPVVAGLVVVLFLWRAGPLGSLEWLYTPKAMVLVQTVLAFPIVVALSVAAYNGVNPRFRVQMQLLGASRWQEFLIVTKEARLGIIAAVAAATGQVFSEVGAVIMVGGNIKGETRMLTTAIVLETRQGNFGPALALSFILIGLILAAGGILTWIQYRKRKG
jgi:tungstate transport system permease protein